VADDKGLLYFMNPFWLASYLRETPAPPQAPLHVPAPQTPAKMTTWTPADIWEAHAQYGAGWEAGKIYGASGQPPLPSSSPGKAGSNTWLWVAAVVAALAVLLLLIPKPSITLLGGR